MSSFLTGGLRQKTDSFTYLDTEIVDGLVFMVNGQYFLDVVGLAIFVRQYLHGVYQEFGLRCLSAIERAQF